MQYFLVTSSISVKEPGLIKESRDFCENDLDSNNYEVDDEKDQVEKKPIRHSSPQSKYLLTDDSERSTKDITLEYLLLNNN